MQRDHSCSAGPDTTWKLLVNFLEIRTDRLSARQQSTHAATATTNVHAATATTNVQPCSGIDKAQWHSPATHPQPCLQSDSHSHAAMQQCSHAAWHAMQHALLTKKLDVNSDAVTKFTRSLTFNCKVALRRLRLVKKRPKLLGKVVLWRHHLFKKVPRQCLPFFVFSFG